MLNKTNNPLPSLSQYIHRYTIDWLIDEVKAGNPKQYVCFWHEDEGYPNPEFCQWYHAPFTVNGRIYSTAEQYMMSEKALLFGDLYRYAQIMEAPSPHECKKLGRAVQGFDPDKWDAAFREIVFRGNLAKFSSDPRLTKVLLDTGDAVIVEASPLDGIYGVGLTENDLLHADGSLKVLPQHWMNPNDGSQATNHLGFVLMGVRDVLRQCGAQQ